LVDPRGGVDWDNETDGQVVGIKTKRIKATTGKLVFLPGYVLHSVEENKSNLIRVSLSTNISIISKSAVKFLNNHI
jgi:hypothetical protein